MNFKCNKCGSSNYTTEKHGNNTGLYCSDCGKWHKWLNKDEVRVYSQKYKEEIIDPDSIEKIENSRQSYVTLTNKLKEFTDYLDKVIDREMMKEPLSEGDSIRKCAYCTALERDKNALLNIIEGKDWRSTE